MVWPGNNGLPDYGPCLGRLPDAECHGPRDEHEPTGSAANGHDGRSDSTAPSRIEMTGQTHVADA